MCVRKERRGAYNVGWIIASDDSSQATLESLPGLSVVVDRYGVEIYRNHNPPGLFVEGQSVVRSHEINRLALGDLSGSTVIVRYHYAS